VNPAHLLATRDELYAACTGAGLETATSAARMAIPGVFIQPADPWILPGPTLKRTQQLISWEIVPIAGRADADGTLEALAQLIATAWGALIELPGWTTPRVSSTRLITANGIEGHLGAVFPMTRLISMEG
jgi:hypothetical protein